jgi:hypothetical protein
MKSRANKKWWVFVLLAFFSLWFGGYVQRENHILNGETSADFRDFNVYYTAGLVARNTEDKRLYSYQEIQDPNDPSKKIVVDPQLQVPDVNSTYGHFAKETGSELQYVYPPFFSLAMVPLTYLPYAKAKIVWHVFIIFLLTCVSIIFTAKLVSKDCLTIALTAMVVITAMEFVPPMQESLQSGNITSIILFLCAAGLLLHKKYPGWGALFFALAVIIKLTPVVVVPLMVVRKQWKWLIAFCYWSVLLWGISIWQLGWQNHQEFLTRVMPAMSQGLPHFENRSLSTVLYVVSTGKFVSFEDARKGAYTPSPIFPFSPITILAILTFGGMLFFFWYVNKTDSQIYIEVFLLLLWSILFSPVALPYNYLLALMPIVFAWIHPSAQRASTFQLMLLSASTFMIYSILPNYAAYLTSSFIIQFAMFLVRPAGAILCMWYLMRLLKSENKVLAEYG